VLSMSVDELKSLATKLLAQLIAGVPIQQAIQYVAEGRSVVEEQWSRLKPSVRARIREFVKQLPPNVVDEMLSPKTVAEVLVKSGRADLASLFVNDPRARQWLRRELETAKRLVLGEN